MALVFLPRDFNSLPWIEHNRGAVISMKYQFHPNVWPDNMDQRIVVRISVLETFFGEFSGERHRNGIAVKRKDRREHGVTAHPAAIKVRGLAVCATGEYQTSNNTDDLCGGEYV